MDVTIRIGGMGSQLWPSTLMSCWRKINTRTLEVVLHKEENDDASSSSVYEANGKIEIVRSLI